MANLKKTTMSHITVVNCPPYRLSYLRKVMCFVFISEPIPYMTYRSSIGIYNMISEK